jgi:hypothetical protein
MTCAYMRGGNTDTNSSRRECTEDIRKKTMRGIYGPVMGKNIRRLRCKEEITALL